jgi:Putative viral replication protein
MSNITTHMNANTRARAWCFTWNNYDDASIALLNGIDCTYMIYGKEVGENGTPHLQGTVRFESAQRFTAMRKLLTSACHIEMCKHLEKSIEYCKKDGDFTERGIPPIQGKRNDLEQVKLAIKENPNITMKQLREDYSEVYAKYERWLTKYVQDNRPSTEVQAFPLRQWQQELNDMLNGPPDNRTVVFVVDKKGNSGKTWFAHYYSSLHEFVDVLPPGRKENMVHVLSGQARVVFIDFPRSKTEHIQYDLFEELKNGYIFAQKYDSMIKKFAVPHVVVMMNEDPDMTKLSADRYKIIEVTGV